MVPYHGHHRAKMFITRKPIRFGYKIWCICSNDGFPYHMKIYQGKEDKRESLPLGTGVVNDLIDVIILKLDITCHELYFDNFFTSYKLLSELSDKGVRATSTTRETRNNNATKKLLAARISKKKKEKLFIFALMEKFMLQSGMTIQL